MSGSSQQFRGPMVLRLAPGLLRTRSGRLTWLESKAASRSSWIQTQAECIGSPFKLLGERHHEICRVYFFGSGIFCNNDRCFFWVPDLHQVISQESLDSTGDCGLRAISAASTARQGSFHLEKVLVSDLWFQTCFKAFQILDYLDSQFGMIT